MKPEKTTLFRYFQVQSCPVAELLYLIGSIQMHIPVTCKINDRHFDMVHKPASCCRFSRHIAQDQTPAWTQHPIYAVKENSTVLDITKFSNKITEIETYQELFDIL